MATINSGSIGDMYLQIDYTVTQNTSNNTSTVRATLKLVNHYALYMSTLGGSYLSVGGQKVDYSKTISYGGGSTTTTTLYGPRDFVVAHNSDGTASCNLTGTFVMNGTYRGYSVNTMTVSQTITLPKIARSSSFTVSSSVNTGSAISGTITPSSTSFNHKVLLKIGSTVKHTLSLATGTNTFSYTIPHSWFPSSTSGIITAELQTMNGTTLVATTSKNITANVPSNIGPSIGSFIVESVDGMNGLSIRGRSRVRLTANATPGSGTTMATYTFSGNNVNEADGSSSRTVYNPANSSVINTGILNYTGGATYTVTVADARGRTATSSLGIEVFEYSNPSILSMSVQRCNASGVLDENGTYAYVTVNSRYTTLYHNNMNYNSRTVVLTNTANSYSATVQNTNNTNGSWSGVYGNGTFATGTTYTITATIKDTAYGSTTSMSQSLKAASRPMNIKVNGKGIGLGKMAETDNLLDVAWNERVRENLTIDKNLSVTGTINEAVVNRNNYITGGTVTNLPSHNSMADRPTFLGTYTVGDTWYNTISVRHRNGLTDGTNYGMQIISPLTGFGSLQWRQQNNNVWNDFKTILDTSNTADHIVEQGESGVWSWKKWNSGRMEVYGTASHNPTALSNGVNSFTVTMPVTFANSSFTPTITPAKCGLLVSSFGDCNSSNGIEHSTNAFVLSYKYNHSPAYTVNFNIMVVGRWK